MARKLGYPNTPLKEQVRPFENKVAEVIKAHFLGANPMNNQPDAIDYEAHREALQAFDAVYNQSNVLDKAGDDERRKIRAGVAFANNMPSGHSELADIRCPNCHVKFSRVDNVDEYLSTLRQAPPKEPT